MSPMAVRQTAVDRAELRAERMVSTLCRELDDGRVGAGLSYAAIGAAVGISSQQARRICRGQSPNVSFVRMAGLLAAVGLDLSSKTYPGGVPLRDAAHVGLLRRFRGRISQSLDRTAEAPVVRPTTNFGSPFVVPDRRAWDALIAGAGFRIGVEAETRLGDVQALERRLALKQRDGDVGAVVLLVNDTEHNRRILRDPGAALRTQFPGAPRQALRLLATGKLPTANTILVL